MLFPKTVEDAIACVTQKGTKWVAMKAPREGDDPYFIVVEEEFKRLLAVDETAGENTVALVEEIMSNDVPPNVLLTNILRNWSSDRMHRFCHMLAQRCGYYRTPPPDTKAEKCNCAEGGYPCQ